MSWRKSGMDHAGEVGADRVGVHCVLEAGRERRYQLLSVVAGPVEPPVRGVLHPAPDRPGRWPVPAGWPRKLG